MTIDTPTPTPTEQFASVNGIELCFETFGDPSHETLLLVMGFTAQMHAWHDGFVERLVADDYHVVRFDNRDVGLSSKSTGPLPDAGSLIGRARAGEDVTAEAPYTLSDMADDAMALLDHLGVGAAHVVGASMGGMIVQELAIAHGERLLSATSIMSTTGHPDAGAADPAAMGMLLAPSPTEREALIAHSVKVGRALAGPLFDPEVSAARAALSYDRCFHPDGAIFQMAAIAASGDRTAKLAAVDVPFLVIHGQQDSLIGVSGGHATHEAVPGADLLVLDAMGHDLPEPLWGQIASAINGIAQRGALR